MRFSLLFFFTVRVCSVLKQFPCLAALVVIVSLHNPPKLSFCTSAPNEHTFFSSIFFSVVVGRALRFCVSCPLSCLSRPLFLKGEKKNLFRESNRTSFSPPENDNNNNNNNSRKKYAQHNTGTKAKEGKANVMERQSTKVVDLHEK